MGEAFVQFSSNGGKKRKKMCLKDWRTAPVPSNRRGKNHLKEAAPQARKIIPCGGELWEKTS